MGNTTDSFWHFPIMILASFILFCLIIWMVLGVNEFRQKARSIFFLSIVCVVFGMLLGKFGANAGLKWWIYYPVPLLINVFLPPLVLKMNLKKTISYLLLSFLSAPFIHVFFSFFFNWKEYLPFWNIPYIRTLFN